MFLDRYQLSDEQSAALVAPTIDAEFFVALDRLKEIHGRCKMLLMGSQQKAGLAIMESMATLQETAYERLYRWTQSTCRGLTQASPEPPAVLARAIAALRDRPVLLEFSLTELGNARHNAVVRAFLDALTRGGVGGTPRQVHACVQGCTLVCECARVAILTDSAVVGTGVDIRAG